MLDRLSLSDFTPLLGDTFTVRAADGEIQTELTEAVAGTPSPAGGGSRDPFSIVFRGPAAPRLQQGLHELVHPTLGSTELFLVPIAADATSAQYQAVFG